jgi:hypothetical protein
MLSKETKLVKRQRLTIPSSQLDECSNQPYTSEIRSHSVRSVQPVAHAQKLGLQPDAANDSVVRPRWLTVNRMAADYKEVISEAALRHLIWNAEAYARFPRAGLPSNGFLPVIVRPPFQRKVLLDRVAFEKWLTTNQA